MASITKRGESYRIAVSDGYRTDGRKIVHTRTWTPAPGMTAKQTERELQRAAVEFENAVKCGQVGGTTTLEAFVARWLSEYADKRLKLTTVESYGHEIRTKILPALGHLRLDKIQPLHIMEYLKQLSETKTRRDKKPGGYSQRTIQYNYYILSTILQSAVYWQVIPANPCDRVKPPAKKDPGQQKIKHFTDDQAGLFLSLITDEPLRYQLLANLGVYVGPRRGEVLALTWNDVDLDAGEINIDKQHVYLPSTGIAVKDTKTSGSVRRVSIPASVIALLRRHKTEQAENRLALGDQWQDRNLLFTRWNGLPMHTNTPRKWLIKFIARHNEQVAADPQLTTEEKADLTLPIIPYHGLRHTSATLLITEGVDVKTASARLGHSQASTFTDIYSHYLKSADRQAADKLESRLEKVNKKGQAK